MSRPEQPEPAGAATADAVGGTTGAATAGAARPLVLRGHPTEEEAAALLAVLGALRAQPGGPDPAAGGFAAPWRARRLAALAEAAGALDRVSRPAPRARRSVRS